MPQVPPERAGCEDVTLPPVDLALEAALPNPPVNRPIHRDLQQIGQYRILEKIGEGGMGVVYKAEQREPVRRVVALKIIKLGMDTKEVVARFEAERQALALMSHPNVAQVFEAGMTEQGRPFFAMELVPGVPVTRYCDDERLTIRQRLELFVPICQAVQHAHQKGIIHRDLKPSNILVELIDGKPVPKVIDFGVAKATNQALTQHTLYTQTGTLVGTPEYMSPEQAMSGGLDVDTRTDIYSLGVILYELLTGTLPVDSKSLRSAGFDGMARLLRNTEPPKPSTRFSTAAVEGRQDDPRSNEIARSRHSDPSTLRRELRGDLDWIVLKGMEKERARRYETANGLAMDIQRHLGDEPVSARPPTTMYRLRKLVRRHKPAFVGATALLLALLIGLATSTVLFLRESVARRRAVAAELGQARLRENETELRRQAQAQELSARQRAYASDMNRMQQALSVDNLGRAQELLNRQRPGPGERDLRGWEWRYLWQCCRSDAQFTLCQRASPILSVTLSHDGARVAIAEQFGGGLSVWDLRTRQLVAKLPAGDGLVSAAFSPADQLLAFGTVSGNGSPHPQFSVRLWDPATGEIVAQLPLVQACVRPVFSEDGRTLFVFTRSQVVRFQVAERKKLADYDADEAMSGNPCGTPFAITPDGSVAAHGAPGGVIQVIDLASGVERWHAKAPDDWVTALAFSPDGKTLASGAGFVDPSILLWEASSGKQKGKLDGHRGWVSSLLFWPDGNTLASSSADQTIHIWDLSDPAHVPASRILRGHRSEVWRLALLPDNRTLVSGCKDGSVKVWDTSPAARQVTRTTVPATLAAWQFASDGNSIVTVDVNGHVARWLGEDLRQQHPVMDIGAIGKRRTVISGDGRLVAAESLGGGVRVWDLQRRELIHELRVAGIPATPQTFQGSNKLVLHCLGDNSLHEWDLTTWHEIRTWRCAPDMVAAAFSPDGRWCLTLGWAGASMMDDFIEGRNTNPQLELYEPQEAMVSSDGKLVAVASLLGFAELIEAPALQQRATLGGFLLGVHSVAFSPDGKRLVATSVGREAVKLWDVEGHQELLTLEGEGSYFHATAFCADGSALGSMNEGGQLHIWRAPSWAQIEAAEKN